VVTVLKSMRPRPALELVIDGRELRLRDPKRDRVLATTPVGMVTTTRGTYTVTGRGGGFETLVLALRLSPEQEVRVSVFDMRYRWSDATPSVTAARWTVGPPDWETLVGLFGLGEVVLKRSDLG
jgi:hypothetical protein